jgi:predicted DNA-binding transcriptional regulator YafY
MGGSSRFFEIIQLLRSAKSPLTAAALADVLEVTTRTVYRDIVTLQSMRVPIEGEAGVGYILRSGFTLPPLMFTEDELEAIVVGLSLIGRTRDAGLQRAAQRVAQKIADVIPCDAGPHLASSPLMVSQWSAIPDTDVCLYEIRQAIRDRRKVHFRYTDPEACQTTRTVRPIGLVYYVDAIVLAAWCELREDFRHFRADRIDRFVVLSETFTGAEALRLTWRAREREIASDAVTHEVVTRAKMDARPTP